MAICIKCGNENDSCLCESCKAEADLEELCRKLLAYKPGSEENSVWEKLCSGFNNPYNLRYLVFAISDDMPAARKAYYRVMAVTGIYANIPKASRPWFYETYEKIKDSADLTEEEKNRLHGIALGAMFMDYDYNNADRIASLLCGKVDIPWQASCNVAEFYTTTRRYDLAESVVADAIQHLESDPDGMQAMQQRAEKNAKQREKAEAGKQEFLPSPRENRDEARQKYMDFLAGIGIEVDMLKSGKKDPEPIPRDQYPDPIETRDTDFDTFVAFDLETTGRSPIKDSIIEIGAIRVVNGEIKETAEYTFQKLAKPFKKRLSEEVQRLTGITADEVKDAGNMWDVFADFMKFVGDDVLVGFNCMAFDSRFMVRAGRYANIIVRNKYFDVMRYAGRFQEKMGITAKKVSLVELSEKLDIENPHAHRALADAVTTARVFLKLKEKEEENDNLSLDDMLADLDNW